MMNRSRRTSMRRDVVLPCQAVRERDFKLVATRTIDVSVEGVLLPMGIPLLTGESIIVSFEIPGTWIDCEALVTRIVHNRRPGDDGLAVGLMFDVISPSSRAALAAFLHGRPPPLPRRGPLARMRRGEAGPRLADQTVMSAPLRPPMDVLDVDLDAIDCGWDDEREPDALGILRAVVGAWQSLVVPAE
jgi:hypothetical protein